MNITLKAVIKEVGAIINRIENSVENNIFYPYYESTKEARREANAKREARQEQQRLKLEKIGYKIRKAKKMLIAWLHGKSFEVYDSEQAARLYEEVRIKYSYLSMSINAEALKAAA